MTGKSSINSGNLGENFTVAILGSFPPIRALSSYCLEFSRAISGLSNVEFISFRKIYPRFLYPGDELKDDHSFPVFDHANLWVRRRLNWYNPVTWVAEGMTSKGTLLHAQWWSLPLIFVYLVVCLCFRLRGRPVVFTVHNVISHERSRLYLFFSRLLFLMGDHFIVHTERNRKELISYFAISGDRVSVVPHGPLDFHVPKKIDRDKSMELLGIDHNERVILFFGSIRPYKGLETALRAFAKVKDEIIHSRLLIAGSLWEDWIPYHKLIEELGLGEYVTCHLKYIPSSEVHRYFASSDLVVLPYTHFDSQSGVGAIALSFRKPLIVTDVGGLRDLVCDRRFVVPPEDPVALANALIACLKDEKILNLMSADSEKMAERMSWSHIAGKTLSIYKKVLRESRGTLK